MARPAGLHLLREDPRVRSAVEAREDDSVPLGIEKRYGERLVATGVRERIEADDPDLLDAPLGEVLELPMELAERVDAPGDVLEATRLPLEDLVETGPSR